MEDLRRIEVPTPFSIGRVNCYVVRGGELALIDPGPRTDEAYETLADHLEATGDAVSDVDRVLVTHPHMDHYGLAARVARESGAEVLAHADAVEQLADPDALLDREQAFFRPFLETMGVPAELVDTVVGLPESYREFREAVDVDRALTDGDVVALGDGGGEDPSPELRAIHTPGHAPGSVCYVASDADAAFTGDHVMMDVSPNPLLTLAPGTTDERTRSLPEYVESLERIREAGATVGHAGHRGRIPDLPARAAEIAAHHDQRKERIAGMIADADADTDAFAEANADAGADANAGADGDARADVCAGVNGDAGTDAAGATNAYRIMKRMFPDLPVTEMFPGMSEVIGHLDLLEDEGRVEIDEGAGVRRYRLA